MCSTLLSLVCLITASSAQSTGTVRLFRNGYVDISQSWSSGIVDVYDGSIWGNICHDYSFGSTEADVICHQLGYTGASLYSNTGTVTMYGTDYAPTIADEASCLFSSYLTMTQCSYSTTISSFCSDSRDVIVFCYSTRIWSSPITGDIRLTGGTYSNQGLLEVYCNGQWGTVCDDHFDSTQAIVACGQLGYNDYDDYDHLDITGDYFQPIYLHYFSGCTWSDNCLTECGGCPLYGISGCSHSEDVTLQCGYNPAYSKVYSTTFNTCIYYAFSSNPTTDPPGTGPPSNDPSGTDPPRTDPPSTDPPSTNSPNSNDSPSSNDLPNSNDSPTFNNPPNSNPPSSSDHSKSGSVSGTIIGIIIGSIVFIVACAILIVVPICVCVYLARGSTTECSSTELPRTQIVAPPTTSSPIVEGQIKSQQTLYPADLNMSVRTSRPNEYELQPPAASRYPCYPSQQQFPTTSYPQPV